MASGKSILLLVLALEPYATNTAGLNEGEEEELKAMQAICWECL